MSGRVVDASLAPEAERKMSLSRDESEVGHLVCCRDEVWEVAFCGERSDHINLEVTVVCTLCVEVARERLPGWSLSLDPMICPNDKRPCPPEDEIDLRIMWQLSQ